MSWRRTQTYEPVEATIDFIVEGGTDTGLGHVVRSARLAREARRRGFRARAFLEGDDTAHAAWMQAAGFLAETLEDITGDFATIVALDHPRDKSAWLAALAESTARPLVIDDEREYRTYAGATPGWRLLPGLHHADASRTPSSECAPLVRLAGPRYAILPETHRRLGRIAPEGRDRLLVSLGGADPHRLAPRVARHAMRALAAIEGRAEETPIQGLDVVFGPAYDDPGARDAARLRQIGCTVHHALDAAAMADRMRHARLALIGFGTSLTELAWHGTPFLSIAHHEADRARARDLETRGIGRVAGSAATIERVAIDRLVRRALLDEEWLRTSADRARDALEGGLGASLVFERIESDLALRPRRPRALATARPGRTLPA